MSQPLEQPTLYQTWQMRRERIAARSELDDTQRMQVQLLDYLLERYKGFPGAQVAAREVGPTMLPHANERAIIVHHHVESLGGGVENAEQAEARVSSILKRMRHESLAYASETIEPHSVRAGHRESGHRVSGRLWDKITRRIRWGFRPDRLMQQALDQSPFLPATALQHLYRRVERVGRAEAPALEMLLQCENRGVPELAARLWRARIVAGNRSAITKRLEEYFFEPDRREANVLRIRLELADDRCDVRRAALRLLRRIGTARDVGLLSDLLEIPSENEADDEEKQDILETLELISQSDQLLA